MFNNNNNNKTRQGLVSLDNIPHQAKKEFTKKSAQEESFKEKQAPALVKAREPFIFETNEPLTFNAQNEPNTGWRVQPDWDGPSPLSPIEFFFNGQLIAVLRPR